MIHRETAEQYHARKAISAGFLWDIVKPDGCPALAFARSVFNPEPLPQKQGRELDIGTACHLAVLEPKLLAERGWILDYDSYRSKEAAGDRDMAIKLKLVPLLRQDYELVLRLRRAIEQSPAGELFFGDGESEVSYTWDIPYPAISALGYEPAPGALGMVPLTPCKARADRVTPHAIVDLKTATSASPEAFQRAMDRDGHHLRAAWYMDGLIQASEQSAFDNLDYVFVVVAKEPPHIISIFSTGEVPDKDGWFHISEESIDKGRMLYRLALAMFRRAQETGAWSGYSGRGENKRIVSLPAYRLNQLYAQERAGAFDADEDIPY